MREHAVVSPLISLIEDQTRYLNELVPGSAAMLSAGMDKRETSDVYRRMRGDDVDGTGGSGSGSGSGSGGGDSGGGGGSGGGVGAKREQDGKRGKGKGGSSSRGLVMVLVTPEKVGLLLFFSSVFSSFLCVGWG